ncbi:MAG: RagB/SusD family nutrient uptake outer membrane protein, partial [Bacteroidales bacterium]|nr:RagB/SusD family nutrient uptake outer membrane protein [Bacteroidales bacterium]
YIIFTITLLLTGLYACEDDFLDTSPPDKLTEDKVFNDEKLLRSHMLSNYLYIPQQFLNWGFLLDENTLDVNPQNGINPHTTHDFSASNSPYSGKWNLYNPIRSINLFIENMDKSELKDLKDLYLAEARLLRAVYYSELFYFFRGVPIITVPQSINDKESWLVPRNSADEVFNFIVSELEASAPVLPKEWEEANDHGRATSGAAYGLLARVLLYQACLKNDNDLYTKAAEAAKRVMDQGIYELFTLDQDIFLTKYDQGNREHILYFDKILTYAWQGWDVFGDWSFGNVPESKGGGAFDFPTQNLVDAFEMIDGQSIDESPLYDPQNPYENRDPRLSAFIYHQGDDFNGVPLEMWIDSDGNPGAEHKSAEAEQTGYFIKKAIIETYEDYYELTWAGGKTEYYDPYLRFADILLMYAEAKNQVSGPTSEVYEAVNRVRARAGIADLPAGLSKEQMFERIKNERRVEFCFEGRRFHDVRRWGIATEDGICGGNVYRMHIVKDAVTGELTYTKEVMNTRPQMTEKYVLAPIPQDDIDKNARLLPNNPGY